jgi:hypothetical protein
MGVLHIILKVHFSSFQLKFLSKRFKCDFYLIIFLNGINWLKTFHRKTQNIVKLLIAMSNLDNQYKSVERKISQNYLEYIMLNYSLPCSCS